MFPCSLGFTRYLKGLTVISAISTAAANCYYPNGTDRNLGDPNDTYYPINPGDDFNTNNSPAIGRQMDNDEQVTPCENGSYCCGDGSLGSTCCNEGRGVFVRDGTTQTANPTSTSTSSISSASSTSSPTANSLTSTSNSTTDSSSPKSGSDAGAIAGGVVGGLAGLAAILVAAWFLFSRRRKAVKAAGDEMAQDWSYEDHKRQEPQEAPGAHTGEYKRSELQAEPVDETMGRSELGSQQPLAPSRSELS
ncbi:MAG: hypothetical protein Q9170_002267 [Blastenia crenularia]